jgi:hypothetical protein
MCETAANAQGEALSMLCLWLWVNCACGGVGVHRFGWYLNKAEPSELSRRVEQKEKSASPISVVGVGTNPLSPRTLTLSRPLSAANQHFCQIFLGFAVAGSAFPGDEKLPKQS